MHGDCKALTSTVQTAECFLVKAVKRTPNISRSKLRYHVMYSKRPKGSIENSNGGNLL